MKTPAPSPPPPPPPLRAHHPEEFPTVSMADISTSPETLAVSLLRSTGGISVIQETKDTKKKEQPPTPFTRSL